MVNISGLLTKGAYNTDSWVVTFKIMYGKSTEDLKYIQDPFNGEMVS